MYDVNKNINLGVFIAKLQIALSRSLNPFMMVCMYCTFILTTILLSGDLFRYAFLLVPVVQICPLFVLPERFKSTPYFKYIRDVAICICGMWFILGVYCIVFNTTLPGGVL